MRSYEIIVAGLIKLCLHKIKLSSSTYTHYYHGSILLDARGRNHTPRSTSEFRPPSVASLLPFPRKPKGLKRMEIHGVGLKPPDFAQQPWGGGANCWEWGGP